MGIVRKVASYMGLKKEDTSLPVGLYVGISHCREPNVDSDTRVLSLVTISGRQDSRHKAWHNIVVLRKFFLREDNEYKNDKYLIMCL